MDTTAQPRTIKLIGGPRGVEYRECSISNGDDRLMLPICDGLCLVFETYRRVGDTDDFLFYKSYSD